MSKWLGKILARQSSGGPVYNGPLVGGGTVQVGDKFATPSITDNSGDGSFGNPWSLREALASGGAAGRTIWLRGGTYPGPNYGGLNSFWTTCDGSAGNPCVVRSYPGEWAKVDIGDTGSIGDPGFIFQGSYITFRDFEIFSSMPGAPHRNSSDTGPAPADLKFGSAIYVYQIGGPWHECSFINMVVHDTSQGFSLWADGMDFTTYGCVTYYHGWEAPDDGHGHNFYSDNWVAPGGSKTIHENISFRAFGECFQSYNESGMTQVNYNVQGNVFFSSGVAAAFRPQRNFLIGGDGTPSGDSTNVIHSNFLYDAAAPGSDFQLGFGPHAYDSPDAKTNYMPRTGVNWISAGSSAGITGNTLTHTQGDDFNVAGNTFVSLPMTGTNIFVRANTHETGRAHIIVYNWDLNSTVNVDISSVFTPGWNYAIYNVQNISGTTPVASGTYSGASITLPMTTGGGLSQAAPSHYATPPATWPEFNVFLLRKTN